jgi:glycosyltransferase involved in cell wall biosynthesis
MSFQEKIRLTYRYKVKPPLDKAIGFYKSFFRKRGLNLLGFFDTPIGIAEVSRQCFLDLNSYSSYPCCILSFPLSTHATQGYMEEAPYAAKLQKKVQYDTNILFFNADYISLYIRDHLQHAQGTRHVGVYWWELEDYFYFKEGVEAVDEIIVFSDFVKQAILKSYPSKKVTKFSFPYSLPPMQLAPAEEIKAKYGLQATDFVVFFNFDFFSGYERKNPEGLVSAFALAFKENKQVKLLLKTIHAQSDNENYVRLQSLLKNLEITDQVVFEDRNLEKSELMSLLNCADIYVSLHRSEGLGIGMMEAMLLGKPVIATGYGGNMEFTTSQTALLVDYDMVEITKDIGPYLKGYRWSEPNVADAATKMSYLYAHPVARDAMKNRALQHLQQFHQGGKFAQEIDAWMNHSNK